MGADAAVRRAGRRPARMLLGAYLVTVFALVTLNFFLPRIMPGDPISALYTEGSAGYVQDSSQREALRAYYGLDEPLGAQYVDYLTGLVQGDLGTSIRYQVPVSELITERLPRSLLLMGTALVLGTGLGVVAGAVAGWRRGRRLDTGLIVGFASLRDIPVFFLGSIALYVFAVRLGWFPLSGSSTPFTSLDPLARAVDVLHHLALPATVLAMQFATGQFLLMRAGMVSELGSDYLLAGRAKGLRDRVLKYRYAGRNALLPVVSLMAIHVSAMVTLTILVETVFRYEGLGRLVFDAIRFRDYPVLQGCFLLLTLMVVTANFLADLAYRRLDPRVAT
ncbi:MAG: ABC transporter permease [Solirubrobacterales bacterium]|nr:ABC transporter permease [Solirubrobacterales bacterium]